MTEETGSAKEPAKDLTMRPPEFGRKLSLLQRVWQGFPAAYVSQPVFEPAEVAALIKYATEQGIDSDGILMRLVRALKKYEGDPDSTVEIGIDGGVQQVASAEVILECYSKLTKLAGGIHGRNLLHGRNILHETKLFLSATFLFFLAAVASLAYGTWRADETSADDPIIPIAVAYAIQYFAPFLWGALGSCIYILKRITDEAAANQFDPDKFKGWLTRALLGAVLGGTIAYVIDPEAFGTVSLSLTTIAFLTGLGTKIVYGALERMIELLAEKMNLNAIRKGPPGDGVAGFLAKEISQTDPDDEPDKYAVLVALLESRTKKA